MKNHIAKLIKELYDFHDYEVPKEKVLRLAEIILSMRETNEVKINYFFDDVVTGKYGILYRMPTCLTSMYHKFLIENANPFIK